MSRDSSQPDIDVAEIAAALRKRPEDVLHRIGWDPKCRRRNIWTAATINGGFGTKVCCWLDGQRQGVFTCFNGPQIPGRANAGGDMLTLLAGARGHSRPTRSVLNEALDILGRPPIGEKEDANAVRERERQREKQLAGKAEREQRAAADLASYQAWIRDRYKQLEHKALDADYVRAYLQGRGIDPDILPSWIRFDPAARYKDGFGKVHGLFPAMVSPMVDTAALPARRVQALHITYLDPDHMGRKVALVDQNGEALPAKKIQAPPSGCCIEISDPDQQARVLVITEGNENGLSVKMLRPDWMVWAAGSVGLIPKLHIPRSIDRLIYLEDGDSAPAKNADGSIRLKADGTPDIPAVEAVTLAAGQAARQRQQSGRLLDVRRVMCPPGTDFNDLIKGMASAEAKGAA